MQTQQTPQPQQALNNKHHISKQEKENADLNKENNILNTFFSALIVVCISGSIWMITYYKTYWEIRLKYKPEGYTLPDISDFKISLFFFPILCFLKYFFHKIFTPLSYKHILEEKFKQGTSVEDQKIANMYARKITTNLFKILYYTSISVFAYMIMKDSSYFPYELMGKGEMINIFEGGFPDYIFFKKPDYFEYYYLISLSYVFTDLVWLLFIYEKQNDFILMLLHHSITISLVVFSYLTNYSQIGVIVFFSHDFSDIFVYIMRIIINIKVPFVVGYTSGVIFFIIYVYMRIFVFGKLIITCAFAAVDDWNVASRTLWYFKVILLIMHIYWVFEIFKRIILKKVEDVGAIKRKN